MHSKMTFTLAVLFSFSVFVSAQSDSLAVQVDSADTTLVEKEAMELGGFLTLDYYAPFDDLRHPSLEVGEVGLGANVFLSDEITATVLIKAEGSMADIFIDQAVAEWKPQAIPFAFYAGQHTLSHGLLTTRLISYTSLYYVENVELIKPALTVVYEAGLFSLGGSATVLNFGALGNRSPTSRYAGVLNADLILPNESLIRLSGLISTEIVDADLAAGIIAGPLSLDMEALLQRGRAPRAFDNSGYYAGIAWSVNDRLELAVRHDGVQYGGWFSDMELSVAAGGSFVIKDDIFGAFEYAYGMLDDGEFHHQISLEVGLESSLKLPGFKRKTLVTRDQE